MLSDLATFVVSGLSLDDEDEDDELPLPELLSLLLESSELLELSLFKKTFSTVGLIDAPDLADIKVLEESDLDFDLFSFLAWIIVDTSLDFNLALMALITSYFSKEVSREFISVFVGCITGCYTTLGEASMLWLFLTSTFCS